MYNKFMLRASHYCEEFSLFAGAAHIIPNYEDSSYPDNPPRKTREPPYTYETREIPFTHSFFSWYNEGAMRSWQKEGAIYSWQNERASFYHPLHR